MCTMPRLYTLLSWLVFFVYIPSLTLAHTIHVGAGKKECFFEDLHVNDQVRVVYNPSALPSHVNFPEDDSNVSSWWRWPSGYRLLGKLWFSSDKSTAMTRHPGTRPHWSSFGQTYQTVDWPGGSNRGEGWQTWVLFLKSDERHRRQDGQVWTHI